MKASSPSVTKVSNFIEPINFFTKLLHQKINPDTSKGHRGLFLSVVAGVIGDANQNKSGLLSISNYKKSPIDLLMSAGKLYEIAKICKDYRSAIIEVYGVKSPSWDTNKPIQTVIIGMHTDNTVKQAIDVRKDSDMIDVYYDSSSVYIKNNYTYAIQVNIVFKQMGDKGDEFMIPALSTKDVSELNKAREVGTVFGYNSLDEL